MGANAGKKILIKFDTDGAGNFQTIGGMRSKSMQVNKETVDVTDSDSVDEWRELLRGAGVRSMTINGSGVFKDSAVEAQMVTYIMDETLVSGGIREFQLIIPELGTFEGSFDISSLEHSGEYNAEQQFSMTLESAGQIGFTASA